MNPNNIRGIYRSKKHGIILAKLCDGNSTWVHPHSGAAKFQIDTAKLLEQGLELVSPVEASALGFNSSYEYLSVLRHETALKEFFAHDAPVARQRLIEYILGECCRWHAITFKVQHYYNQPESECGISFSCEVLDPEDPDRTINKTVYIDKLRCDLENIFGTADDIHAGIADFARAKRKKDILDTETKISILEDQKKKLMKLKF